MFEAKKYSTKYGHLMRFFFGGGGGGYVHFKLVLSQAAQAQAVAVLLNSGHGENIRVCMG